MNTAPANRAFTLIETIVYIALLGLMVTTAVLAAYEILQGSTEVSTQTTVQDEGNFVLRKIEWALSGASDISGGGSSLTVTRYDGNTVNVQLNSNAIRMSESNPAMAFTRVTTDNVSVESLQVVVSATSPKSVTVTATIKTANGTDTAVPFALTRYVRL